MRRLFQITRAISLPSSIVHLPRLTISRAQEARNYGNLGIRSRSREAKGIKIAFENTNLRFKTEFEYI